MTEKNNDNREIAVREKEEIEKREGDPIRQGVFYSPAVDIFESEEAITLIADVPGVDKEKLDIKVEDRKLTITGLVDETEERLRPVYTEYGIGGYTRGFTLSDAIDDSKIKASYENGVLTLSLPKAERHKTRKIEVAAS
jgi:HSP20 family protein